MRDKIALFAAPKFFFSSKNALPLSVKRFFLMKMLFLYLLQLCSLIQKILLTI